MDKPDFDVLLANLTSNAARLSATLDGSRGAGRGSSFLLLARHYVDGALQVVDDLRQQFDVSPDPNARAAVERKALRLKFSLDGLHMSIVTVIDDVGRTDIPTGLIYLIDALGSVLLPEPCDALVHIDSRYMYSVEPPARTIAKFFDGQVLPPVLQPQPVVFNLPGADPMNVLLAPILAHEVGHPAVNERDLTVDFNATVDSAAVQPIWDACLAMGTPAGRLLEISSSWISELFCDAFAVALTGPSMLFASLVFLPGPVAGRFGKSHPDPAHRLALTFLALDDLGWTEWLSDSVPAIDDWGRKLAGAPIDDDVDDDLKKLSEAVPYFNDAVWKIAKQIVGAAAFKPDLYVTSEAAALELLDVRVPPVEMPNKILPPWEIVLAAWTSAIKRRGGDIASLDASANDVGVNALALKAIELACVTRLWRD